MENKKTALKMIIWNGREFPAVEVAPGYWPEGKRVLFHITDSQCEETILFSRGIDAQGHSNSLVKDFLIAGNCIQKDLFLYELPPEQVPTYFDLQMACAKGLGRYCKQDAGIAHATIALEPHLSDDQELPDTIIWQPWPSKENPNPEWVKPTVKMLRGEG